MTAAPAADPTPRADPTPLAGPPLAGQPVAVQPLRFRRALGHFCTGVTVVTSVDDTGPVGFACQSFAALSLDPPLVLFCPAIASGSWQRIRRTGRFCVNVLTEEQRELSRVFGTRGVDKFADVAWSASPAGAAVLDGVLTWVDCHIEAVHEAGDHHVVTGRVLTLGPVRDARPLLFYRGRYAGLSATSPHDPPEVVDTLLGWPRHTDWI